MSEDWERSEISLTPPRPLLPAAPRSAVHFPLVALLAILPGLYGLQNWDLTPPGPWWGLRALFVLDGHVRDQADPALARETLPPPTAPGSPTEPDGGRSPNDSGAAGGAAAKEGESPPIPGRRWLPSEWEAYRRVALQPPLYAWLQAAAFHLVPDRNPIASVLPSYFAGALAVMLVYLLGKLWHGATLGLVAALLLAFNPALLESMQRATPTTVGLLAMIWTIHCHARHREAIPGRRFGWTVLGGIGVGVGLLSIGPSALVPIPVILLHHAYLRADAPPDERPSRRRPWRSLPGILTALIMMAIGLALAGWWYFDAQRLHGIDLFAALARVPDADQARREGLPDRLTLLAPAILPLGAFGVARNIIDALRVEGDDRERVHGGALLVIWCLCAGFLAGIWESGPIAAENLFLLVPLTLLAAQTIIDLANRDLPIRWLTYLAPLTATSVAWWSSGNFRDAFFDLWSGRLTASTALGLHLGLDLVVALGFALVKLNHWARRRDDRQRAILGGFLFAVLAVSVSVGVRELKFRHDQTRALLELWTAIRRRAEGRPFELVAVVGNPLDSSDDAWIERGPGAEGRLRFILRCALPDLDPIHLDSPDALRALPEVERLVIFHGVAASLPYSLQSELNLEAIHPSQIGRLDALATIRPKPERGRRTPAATPSLPPR